VLVRTGGDPPHGHAPPDPDAATPVENAQRDVMARARRVHAGMIRSGGTAMVLAADSTAAAGLDGQCTPTVATGPRTSRSGWDPLFASWSALLMVRQPAMLRRAWFGRVPLHIATSMGQGPDVQKSLNALAHAHGRHARQRGACYPQCLISFVLSGSHAIQLVGVGFSRRAIAARSVHLSVLDKKWHDASLT
jgi:hypothetical protein